MTMTEPSEKDKQQFQRAMMELRQGDPQEAVRLFEEVRKSWRNDPDILYLEGCAWGRMGYTVKVKEVSNKALEINPDHFGALCNLANSQMLMDEQDKGLENYRRALEIKPDAPEVLDNYGRALSMLGRYDEAIEFFKTALEHNKNYAPVYAALGGAYSKGGIPSAAMKAFRKALELEPNNFNAHMGIAGLYNNAGDLGQAEHHYREAIRIEDRSVEARLGLASLFSCKGDRYKSLEILKEAEQIGTGDNFVIAACRADCLEHLGEYDQSYEILSKLAEENRMTPTAVATYSKLCMKYGMCDEALELINLSIDKPTTDMSQKQNLRYMAGALLDKLGRYDEAFEYYKQANDSVEMPVNFDTKGKHDQLIRFFSKDTLAKMPRARTGSERPIFILGMPRSGTSLTEQILSSHPDVYGAGELVFLKQVTTKIGKTEPGEGTHYTEKLPGITEQELTGYANQYLDDIKELNSDARFVTDKMPHNFQLVGMIALLFPDARIIHCRRNPLDCGLSIYFQNFIWSHDYAADLAGIGRFYGEYERLMRHWEQVIDNPMMTIQYEDMIDDQEGVTRQLLAFCDLEWNDAVLEFHESKRNVATASYDQVRQPLYKSSHARWKNYARHLGLLKDALPVHCVLGIDDIDMIPSS